MRRVWMVFAAVMICWGVQAQEGFDAKMRRAGLVDVLAVGVLQYLQQAGLRVPQDVMIATRYDGLRARTCTPPLTAVNLHLDEVARQATQLLMARLDGDQGPLCAMAPDPEIVARAATARLGTL